MHRKEKQLGSILVEKGIITNEQLGAALAEQKKTKEFLGAILMRIFGVKEGGLLSALSEQFDVPLVRLKDRYIDWNMVKQFSPSFILDSKCFPVHKDMDSVTIAVTNLLDMWLLKKAEDAAGGLKLKLALASEDDIKDAVRRYREYVRNIVCKPLK
jgi:hypothetical protein